MFNLRIIIFYAAIAIPIMAASEKDQLPEENKNINLYLVPPPGQTPFIPKYNQRVYRESGVQHLQPAPVYAGYSVRSEPPEDEKIAIKVLQEDQKSFVVQPSYNDGLGSRQSQPQLEFRNPEDPNTKYALQPEGPKQTKVTVKVIKEHKKTYAVDPAYIENQSVAPEYNKPGVIYKSIEPQYINSESVYKTSNPEYTKYELKADDDKEKSVFVKVVEDEKKTYVADPNYHGGNSYYKPEYRKIEHVYTDSEPRYKVPESEYNTYRINEEQPIEKDIIVKVVKDDKNAFNVEPKFKRNVLEPEYRQTVTEYGKPEPSYVKYEVNKPNVLVKVVKENQQTFVAADPQYTNEKQYLVPAYRKSATEYEKTESEYRHKESDHHKYEDHEDENTDKKVFVKVLKEDKKTFLDEPKYKSDKSYQEPIYQKSVTEYRNSEPEYRRSEPGYDKDGENEREKKVYVKEDHTDSKHENDDAHFESEYRKSEPEYRRSEPSHDKYGENEREKKVYVREDNNKYMDSKHENDDAHFEQEYRKSVTEYRNSEPEYRRSEPGHDKYGENEREKKVYVREDNKKYIDSKHESDEAHFEPENRKSETDYEKSEAEYRRTDDSGYHKDNAPKEKEVYVKVIKDNKSYVDSTYKNNDRDFKSENRKSDDSGYHKYEVRDNEPKEKEFKEDKKYRNSINQYEKSEPQYKKSEPNYDRYDIKDAKHQEDVDTETYATDSNRENDHGYNDKQSESDHDTYEDHGEEHKEEKELVKKVRDTFDNTRSDSDYKKYDKEYKESEPKSNSDESKHDVLIKIWSNKS